MISREPMEEFDLLQQTVDQDEETSVDINRYLRGIWKRKWLAVLLAILVSIPFYYRAKNQMPVYKASVFIKTKAFDKDAGRILNKERQVELRSRTFMEQVTARMGLALTDIRGDTVLDKDEVFAEFYTSTSPVPGWYAIVLSETGHYYLYKKDDPQQTVLDSANVWDAVDRARTVNGFTFRFNPMFVKTPKQVQFKIRPFDKAVRLLNSRLTVVISKTGATMRIDMRGTDPDKLPEELNRIAEVYVEETLELKQRDISSRRKTLEQRLAAADEQVKKAATALKRFYEKYPLSLDAEKRSILDRLQTCNRYLRELPQQREQLTQLLDRLRKNDGENDPQQYRRLIVRSIANFPAMSNEPTLALLRETLAAQERRYDQLLDAYSADYPPIIELKEQIKETQDKIIAFASQYRNTLVEKEKQYRDQLAEIQVQLKKLPNDEYQLMELERNKEIADRIYNSLYSEIQKLSVSEIVESDEIAILDRAIRPSAPINPSKKQTVVLGGGLGLLLGILLAVVLEVLDKSIQTVDDIERYLHLPVIGVIPVVDFKDIPEFQDFEKVKLIDRQLVTDDYSPTPIGEAYRSLRTHLMFSKNTGRIQTLLVTSIQPEDGKSFTAGNLAIIVAQQRTNTLLVDADLRRGVLHNTFGVAKEPGLTNYLSTNTTLTEIVHQTHIPNLSVISCGSMIPNPSELLGSLQMRRFLEEVRRKFDLILFDTPPLDAATDAVVLGTQVDAVTVVVRAKKTDRNLAKEKLEIFQTVPANLVGVILNGSDTALVQNYSYYHY